MIQLLNYSASVTNQVNTFYLNTQSYRTISNSTTIYYLAGLESIMENVTTYVMPGRNVSSPSTNARTTTLDITLSSIANAEAFQRLGQVNVGNVEGFFNFTLYEQTSSTNLDPTDSSVKATIYQGLAYITSGDAEVSYTSYDTTDTNTVYVR